MNEYCPPHNLSVVVFVGVVLVNDKADGIMGHHGKHELEDRKT